MSSKVGGIARAPVWGANLSYKIIIIIIIQTVVWRRWEKQFRKYVFACNDANPHNSVDTFSIKRFLSLLFRIVQGMLEIRKTHNYIENERKKKSTLQHRC